MRSATSSRHAQNSSSSSKRKRVQEEEYPASQDPSELFMLLDAFARRAGESAKAVLTYLSIIEHLNDFLMGVVSTSHVIYYVSLILVGLFLTYRSLDSLRWRS